MTVPARTARRGTLRSRPAVTLVAAQLGSSARGLLRSLIAPIFTFGMPVAWLLLIGSLVGDAVADPATGTRVMQYATPSAMAMGAFFGTFPACAIAVGDAKERLLLKRLRTTPMTGSAYVTGVVAAAAGLGAASAIITVGLAIVLYGVKLPAGAVLPILVTLVLGLLTFCALGFAIAALTTSRRIAEVSSIGLAVVLSFISGVYFVGGGLPDWLDAISRVFPLAPFVTALQRAFDPAAIAQPWSPGDLAVVTAWGIAATVAGALAFRWVPSSRRRDGARVPEAGAATPPSRTLDMPALAPAAALQRTHTGGSTRRVLAHTSLATRGALRHPGDLFFSLAVPVGLFLLLNVIDPSDDGPRIIATAAGMTTWGVAVVSFMDTADDFSRFREIGLLRRLSSTPTTTGELIAGRWIATLGLAIVISLVLLALTVTVFGVATTVGGALLGIVAVLVGSASLAACGHLLAAAIRSARAMGAAALLTLFVLAFFSKVFVPDPPSWMLAVGSIFPLAHLVDAIEAAWNPEPRVAWVDLGILAAWALFASIAAGLITRSRHGTS